MLPHVITSFSRFFYLTIVNRKSIDYDLAINIMLGFFLQSRAVASC